MESDIPIRNTAVGRI